MASRVVRIESPLKALLKLASRWYSVSVVLLTLSDPFAVVTNH